MRKPPPSLFAALISLILTAAFALAAPLHAQNTIHVPADQPTIQAGINAANAGDTVLVAPGTYYENIDFKGKAITVTSSAGAAATTIDGGFHAPAVSFATGETRSSVLSNFTIQHGGNFESYNGTSGGITFEKGGVFVQNSTPTILNNVITANRCWGIETTTAGPLVQGNEISATQDPGQCSFGGGAAIYVGSDYSASFNSRSVPITINGNIIENNVQSGFEDAGGNGGAAVAVWGGNPIISNNIMRYNNSPGGSGGAINLVYAKTAVVFNNLIYGNKAGCGGGAIAYEGVSAGAPAYVFANNTIVDNTATATAGYSECQNMAQIYPGTGTYGETGTSAIFVNNIISGNTSTPAINCDEYHLYGSSTPIESDQPIFDHNILYNAGSGQFFGSNCVDVSAKYGNLAVNPQLANAAGNDDHLTAASPAIDAGNNSVLQTILALAGVGVATDFDGKIRRQDATGKGYPVIDIGAYEYGGLATVSPTTVVLTSSAYSGSAGSTYKLTATLASALGTPTGSLDFYLDGSLIGTGSINAGVATLSNFIVTPGVHNLYAQYAGQTIYSPAISVVILLNISKYSPTLTLTSSGSPSAFGNPVTFSVTASSVDGYIPSPITLTDNNGSTPLATLTPNSAGKAFYTTSALNVGAHYITTNYAGDSTHDSASANVFQQVVNPYATTTTVTATPSTAVINTPVTLTAVITSSGGSAPTGSVAFVSTNGTLGTQLLTANANGTSTATLTTSALPLGLFPVSANYVPTGSFAASANSTTVLILSGYPTITTLASSLNPSIIGQTVAFTAQVSAQAAANGTPTGTIAFTVGGALLATQPLSASGAATFPSAALPRGANSVVATYNPTGSFAASSATLIQTVNGLTPQAVFSASPAATLAGSPVGLFATVSGTGPAPTGLLTFYSGSVSLGTVSLAASSANASSASMSTTALPAGTDPLTCHYSGDFTYSPAACNTVPVTVTLAPSALTLSASPNPGLAYTAVVYTARLSSAGAPVAGDVVFTFDGNLLGRVVTTVNGVATLATSLPAGVHAVTASFLPTAVYAASIAQLTETINPAPTSTALIAAPSPGLQNQPVTLVATVAAPVPLTLAAGFLPSLGMVQFFDGTTLLGAAPVQTGGGLNPVSSATLTYSRFAPGIHGLTAVFTPATANYLASTSAPLSLEIDPSDFAIVTAAPSLTLETEHHGDLGVSLTSIGGLSGNFTLTCGALPDPAICRWPSETVYLPASGAVTTGLHIETDAVLNFKSSVEPRDRVTLADLLPLGLLGLMAAVPGRRRKRPAALFGVLAGLLLLATSLTGCGDKYPAHVAPGSYVVQINATGTPAGATTPVTHTATFRLIVTQ